MLSFANDYQEGAHEKILQRLIETNLEPVSGYGNDPYCERAKEKIRTACECPEAGAIEYSGHKVLTIPQHEGKIHAEEPETFLRRFWDDGNHEHMVIPLYMDGARLGYGLMSSNTDVTLSVISRCCDAFYIGGTKVGALCGEAVVFPKNNTPKHFLTRIKQHGALLAKE